MKAPTLLVTLVALVILAFCFSLSIIIFVSVVNASESKKLLYTTALINEISLQTQRSEHYLDEEIRINEFKFVKRITKKENTNNLIEMKIVAYDSYGHHLAERQEFLIISEPLNEE